LGQRDRASKSMVRHLPILLHIPRTSSHQENDPKRPRDACTRSVSPYRHLIKLGWPNRRSFNEPQPSWHHTPRQRPQANENACPPHIPPSLECQTRTPIVRGSSSGGISRPPSTSFSAMRTPLPITPKHGIYERQLGYFHVPTSLIGTSYSLMPMTSISSKTSCRDATLTRGAAEMNLSRITLHHHHCCLWLCKLQSLLDRW
jgi:hypothetical protein